MVDGGGDEDDEEGVFGSRFRTGQVERFNPSGSSSPFLIDETLVLEKREDSAPSSAIRSRSPRARLAFSVIVATVCGGALYRCVSACQSNWMTASLAASQTCISS